MAMKTHFKDDCIFSIFEKTPAFMKEEQSSVDFTPPKNQQIKIEPLDEDFLEEQ